MHFDPESNLLSWELSKAQIVDTKVVGNLLLHLGKTGQPVLVEVLDASKLVGAKEKNLKLHLGTALGEA